MNRLVAVLLFLCCVGGCARTLVQPGALPAVGATIDQRAVPAASQTAGPRPVARDEGSSNHPELAGPAGDFSRHAFASPENEAEVLDLQGTGAELMSFSENFAYGGADTLLVSGGYPTNAPLEGDPIGSPPSPRSSSTEGELVPDPDGTWLAEFTAAGEQELRLVWSDHANFYSLRSLAGLGLGVGFAAVLANTNLDQRFQNDFQFEFRTEESDGWSDVVKPMGEGKYVLPIYAGAVVLGSIADDWVPTCAVGEWGGRSLCAVLVGAPPMLLLQKALGGSRPKERHSTSQWSFWQDDNGVSGHSFMGAVPFITAAKMTDNEFAKAALYAGSIALPWSRVNDNAHYISQAALGWWIAYLAASAIDDTGTRIEGMNVGFIPVAEGFGFGLMYER